MTYFDLYVRDRQSGAEVMLGSLLERRELLELVQVLQQYDNDFEIIKKEVRF